VDQSNYICLRCEAAEWRTYSTYWECTACSQAYPCVSGIPRLYLEAEVGQQDRALRDFFYNGILGRYYQHIMPFLALPVRPWKLGWLVYFVILAAVAALVWYAVSAVIDLADGDRGLNGLDIAAFAVLLGIGLFLAKHRYLLYLFFLAIPVKLSLLRKRFRSEKSFAGLHRELIERVAQRAGRLKVLDISTGTCNSLYRHGWMDLDAEYVGLDLSETMLLQGQALMTARRVPMDFVLGDAMKLPFQAETFDVVLNYGALNGYSDAGQALGEMSRVAKTGGLVLVLDEQIYDQASAVERVYFRRVLSNHNVYHRFPTELLPPALAGASVHQIYHFYYIAAAFKQ
jgi:ubiquinone/menaquinone biosynthesis C-methylase UbiE